MPRRRRARLAGALALLVALGTVCGECAVAAPTAPATVHDCHEADDGTATRASEAPCDDCTDVTPAVPVQAGFDATPELPPVLPVARMAVPARLHSPDPRGRGPPATDRRGLTPIGRAERLLI